MMKRNRKVMLTLDENLYFEIQKQAKREHIPVATYVKIHLAKLMGGDDIDGK